MPVVYLLALAVFAQGTSEFMLAGLVPEIAAGLSVTVAAAGSLTSAYAVGMVVGAPAMALLSRRWSPRSALLAFLSAFLLVHVVAATTGSYGVLVATRVVAAVANAGFLAVALGTAAAMAGPRNTGRATSVLLGGVTVACIAGVPGGAFLGQLWGWRAPFWAVAAACVPALIARALRAATGAPRLAGAYATAAMNAGAAAGPWLAGAALTAGVRTPLWVSAALVTAAGAVAVSRPRRFAARR